MNSGNDDKLTRTTSAGLGVSMRGVRLASQDVATRARSSVGTERARRRTTSSARAKLPTSRLDRARDRASEVLDRRRVGALAALVALVVVAMLYGPTRDWYVALRKGQDLQERYEALSAENEALEDDLERLQTRDGIEDEARRRGYVAEGETSVVVENLPDDLDDEQERPIATTEAQDTRNVLVRVVDFVFGYQGNAGRGYEQPASEGGDA